MSIKYYRLAKDEEPPEDFCAVRDVGGEPSEYVFYVPERENAKLRELAVLNWEWAHSCCGNNCKMQTDGCGYQIDRECNYEREIYDRMRELGVEVEL
jgi:hypothetical protein